MSDTGPLVSVAVGLVIAFTFLVGFTLLALGFEFFWVVFPIGFGGLLPVAVGLAKQHGDTDDREESKRETAGVEKTNEQADALALLREQYARGDIAEEEFERRLERLFETESVEAAEEYVQRDSNHESVVEKER